MHNNRYPNPEFVSYEAQDELLTGHHLNQDAQLFESGTVARTIKSMRGRIDSDPEIQKMLARGFAVEDIIPSLDDEHLSAEVGACDAVSLNADGSLHEYQELFLEMRTCRFDSHGEVYTYTYPRIPIARLVGGVPMHLRNLPTADDIKTMFVVHALVREIEVDESMGLLPNISADKMTIVRDRNPHEFNEA